MDITPISSDGGMTNSFRILTNELEATDPSNNNRRLPVELLQQIFVFCLGWFDIKDYLILCNICGVCGLWRAAAIGMPSLWANITVEIHKAMEEPKLPLLRLWLERSGSVPLSWSIAELGYKFNPNLVEVYLDLFAVHFRRSRVIHLMLRQEHFHYINLLAGCVSMLEEADIAVWPHFDRGDQLSVAESDTISRFLRSSSLLRTFHLQFGRTGLHSLDVPWTQLTNIHIKASLAIDHVLHILHACTNLIEARFEGVIEESGSQLQIPSRSRILCPKLQSLRLYALVDLAPLLEKLYVPSLLDVAIEYSLGIEPWPWAMISQLSHPISQSKACLQSLSLFQVPFSEGDLISIFRASPGLICLEIEKTAKNSYAGIINDHILDMLTYKGTDTELCLLPKLERITMGCCLHSSDGVFGTMMASRYSQVGCEDPKESLGSLRYVYVECVFKTHKMDIHQLRKMQNEGLILDLFLKNEDEGHTEMLLYSSEDLSDEDQEDR